VPKLHQTPRLEAGRYGSQGWLPLRRQWLKTPLLNGRAKELARQTHPPSYDEQQQWFVIDLLKP
jgi:hypothetical protein